MPELDHQTVTRSGTNLVAFSGGPDSVCLLHLLLSTGHRAGHRAGHRERLRVVHVDHGLDPDSAARALQARDIARAMGLDCRIELVAPDCRPGAGGPEAAARHARYARLQSMLDADDHVLTAHHADDQVETIVLRLLRGAGPRGLAGMQPLRRLQPGWLGRPLLAWTREQILEYLQQHRLEYLHDPTNRDLSLDRNYLRHRVLPAIGERWPDYRSALLQSARWQRTAATVMAEDADRTFACLSRIRGCSGETLLDLEACLALDTERAFAAIRAWCDHNEITMPPTRTLREFRGQCGKAAGDRQPVLDWSHASLHSWRDHLWLDLKPLPPPHWRQEWPDGNRCPVPAGGELEWSGIARSAIGKHWIIGPPAAGARLRIHPERPQQRVSELMRNAGIPPWRRHRLPALSIDGKLCAVGLEWMDCEFAARLEQDASRLEWHGRPAALLP